MLTRSNLIFRWGRGGKRDKTFNDEVATGRCTKSVFPPSFKYATFVR